MRPDDCRELADHPTPEALARHLEACAPCALASKLDRVWEATRPAEPSPATLDALWSRASIELDRIEAARRSGASSRANQAISIRRRRRVFVGLALAQAAVILIGVGITLARRGVEPIKSTEVARSTAPTVGDQSVIEDADPSSTRGVVDVGFDETVVVRIGEDGHRVDKLADASVFPTLADTSHDVFNALESMATP